jgi:alpha-tubulin suppressor-like RCC1 family protein
VAVSTTELFTTLAAGAGRFPLGIETDNDYTCGLTTSSALFCWGSNSSGQLGDGTTTRRLTPVAVSTTERFTTLTAGGAHTCGVATGGTALCWGSNLSGQLGNGEGNIIPFPRPVLFPQQ